MADTRYQPQTRTGTQVQIDQGLRSYMLGVYNYMALGVAITGAAAYGTFQAAVDASGANPLLRRSFKSLKWVFFIATLGLGFFAPRLIFRQYERFSRTAAYWAYAPFGA